MYWHNVVTEFHDGILPDLKDLLAGGMPVPPTRCGWMQMERSTLQLK